MDADWITSPAARRILVHWADQRPAWLWSHDGTTLLWRNTAARLFNGKLKKAGVRLAADPVPIKGQVARLIRLGSPGRSSLSRVQFLAGGRPVATTCTCTPLALDGDESALLLVAVDPVAEDVRASVGELQPDAMTEALFPAGWSYELVTGEGAPAGADAISMKAGPGDEMLVLTPHAVESRPATIEDVRAEEGVETDAPSAVDETQDLADMPEPMLPMGLEPVEPTAAPDESEGEAAAQAGDSPDEPGALSSLFDRLAEDADLYSPLTQADERFAGQPAEPPSADGETVPEDGPVAPAEPDLIATVIEYADDPESEAPLEPTAETPPAPSQPSSHWLITGRGFRALPPRPASEAESIVTPEPPSAEVPTAAEPDQSPDLAAAPMQDAEPKPEPEPESEPVAVAAVDEAPDAETAERVSRYNFEELGRILTDRVATEPKADAVAEIIAATSAPAASPAPTGIINLNAETLVLNRLPLAILVFRDQQVLFANRALTDLLGHESVEGLRAAGIASIFPSEDSASAGPVNRLVRRDGTPLNVTARLQSVSWQGRAALMLSASAVEPMRGHEGAVRAFAEIAAQARGEGYISADRAGIVTFVSAPGRALLGRTEPELVGKPLAVLVGKPDMEPLRIFLERPARFAETARPAYTGVSENGEADIALFAEGQAGIVSGYFGFLRKRTSSPAPQPNDDLDSGVLGRLSRGIRRPLNTIVGFADLIGSAAPGHEHNERVAEYARDIRTAGLEIAVLADELDDYTRLREGRYAPRPSDVDLSALLESCMIRVRPQAGAARVLVRSAISEKLPRIRADQSSLGQALLNLLASAIDQTPIGGSVILSAQSEDDGSINIHVRDGAQANSDPGERFVVFRDGVDKDGEQLSPVRSTVGLALTRSLLAVNACSLSVDPTPSTGTLFALTIPADAIIRG